MIFLCVVDVQLCGIARYSSKSYNNGIARNPQLLKNFINPKQQLFFRKFYFPQIMDEKINIGRSLISFQ